MDCDGGFCRSFRCQACAGTREARDFCQTTTFHRSQEPPQLQQLIRSGLYTFVS